jgi:hypothetical protein
LGAWGTLIHEKNLKSKISCQTPFKQGAPAGEGTTSTAKTSATAGSVWKSYKSGRKGSKKYDCECGSDKKIGGRERSPKWPWFLLGVGVKAYRDLLATLQQQKSDSTT